MCGIFGTLPAIDEGVFRRSLDALAHRGPDGMGLWNDNEFVQLGHRRLSILDLSDAGKQPMVFEDLVLVFNGEIYNYLEIRAELIAKGYGFQTQSDSEVLLKAFHCWGEDSLPKLNGMWAFAVYNSTTKEIFLCRDRYGVKPLYFFSKNGKLLFSSELKALHVALGRSHSLNTEVLSEIAAGKFDWHGKTETWLKGVSILGSGCFLKGKAESFKLKQWYTLAEREIPGNLNTQAEELQYLLRDACKIRLRSDVPIGTCLSGGLDSSSITALINTEKGNYTHKSFCASFPGTPIDEASKAYGLAGQLNLSLTVVPMLAPSIHELEVAMVQCDGPMHALAFFPIWKLYQAIRQEGIKVTLDGQGPDEMMGGYRPIGSAIRYAVRNLDMKYAWDLYRVYSQQGETVQVSSKQIAAHQLRETIKSEIKRPLSLLVGRQKRPIYQHPFKNSELDEEFYQSFFRNPLPGILQQYDRCSMAHGVECRMPFMDYRVVEFLFSLPPKSKIGGGYTKRVLREAVKNIVPDTIRLDKTKIGFNAPIVDWYRGSLKGWMLDIMSSRDYLEADFFDGKRLRNEFYKFTTEANPQWATAWRFWGGVHFAWWKNKMTF